MKPASLATPLASDITPCRARACPRLEAFVAAFWCVFALALLWGAPALGQGLGAAWFALGFASPAALLYSLALALPWFGDNPGGGHDLLFLLEVAMAGGAAGHFLRRARGRVAPRFTAFDAWIGLFVVWSWITLLPQARFAWLEFKIYGGGALFRVMDHYGTAYVFGLQMILKLTLGVAFYAMLRDADWPPARLRRLAGCLLAGLALSVVLGLLDYVDMLPLTWWRPLNADSLRFEFRRLQSLYWHAGWYAEYVTLLAPLALALAWQSPRRALRAVCSVFCLLIAIATLLTHQRGGWFALIAGWGTVILLGTQAPAFRIWLRRAALRTTLVVAAIALLAFGLAVLVPHMGERLRAIMETHNRTDIWRAAWEVYLQSPWTGVGIGAYHTHFRNLIQPGTLYWVADAVTSHNVYYQTLIERGLPGLLLLLMILIPLALRSVVLAAHAPESRRVQSLALAGAWAAFLIYGIVQEMFYIRTVEILFFILLALTVRAAPELPAPRPWSRRARALAAALLLCAAKHVRENHYLIYGFPNIYHGTEVFIGAGQKVILDVPPEARRVRVRMLCKDMDLPQRPAVYKAWRAGRELATHVATDFETWTWEFDVSDPTHRGEPLVLTSQHTWSPMALGFPYLAYTPSNAVGVTYQPLEVLE